MTIKILSERTRERVGSLLAYLAVSFPDARVEEPFESVETDTIFLSIDRGDEGRLYAGVSGALVSHAQGDTLAQFARELDLAAALRQVPQGQRVWMVASGPEGSALRVAPRDDHSPDGGREFHAA